MYLEASVDVVGWMVELCNCLYTASSRLVGKPSCDAICYPQFYAYGQVQSVIASPLTFPRISSR
jgi:hypothetical protein